MHARRIILPNAIFVRNRIPLTKTVNTLTHAQREKYQNCKSSVITQFDLIKTFSLIYKFGILRVFVCGRVKCTNSCAYTIHCVYIGCYKFHFQLIEKSMEAVIVISTKRLHIKRIGTWVGAVS